MKKLALILYILLSGTCLFAGSFDSIDSATVVDIVIDGGNTMNTLIPTNWIPFIPNEVVIASATALATFFTHKLLKWRKNRSQRKGYASVQY